VVGADVAGALAPGASGDEHGVVVETSHDGFLSKW
jgi:hypothetical protein